MQNKAQQMLTLFFCVFCLSIASPSFGTTSGDIPLSSGLPAVGAVLENNTQFDKYHNEKTGHGFAAEDANALHDTLNGRSVNKTGHSNELNGPDRIVDGQPIQTKYYETPKDTLKSFFTRDGVLRYDGQALEVPSDQYDEIIDLFKEKILRGEIKDANGNVVTDPAVANDLIKKGYYTYKQVRNIAKIGNIDSLTFDVRNNAVACTGVAGVTFAISTSLAYWNGADLNDAVLQGPQNAGEMGLFSMATSVASSQLLRTRAAVGGTFATRHALKTVYRTSLGKPIIEVFARSTSGKALHGAAAINHSAKVIRTTGVVAVAGVAISTAPDFYRAAVSKSISWKQFTKNATVTAAGTGGAVLGGTIGATIGATIGSVVPIAGTTAGAFVGGAVGGMIGGYTAGTGSQAIVDTIALDDSEEMLLLTQNALSELAYDHLLLEDETSALMQRVQDSIDYDFLTNVYMSGSDDSARTEFVYHYFDDMAQDVTQNRAPVSILDIEREIANSAVQVDEAPTPQTDKESFLPEIPVFLLVALVVLSGILLFYVLKFVCAVVVYVMKKVCILVIFLVKLSCVLSVFVFFLYFCGTFISSIL